MSAALYLPIFLFVMAVLCYSTAVRYYASPGYELQEQRNGWTAPFIICLILTFWLGFRPISGVYFGDTSNYAASYDQLTYLDQWATFDWHSEWVWQFIMISCKSAGLSVHAWFTIIEAGYVFFAFWAIKRILPSHTMLAMLFVWSSLMYYSFGVNGLRNGLACHILLLALTYILDKKMPIAIALFLLAFGIHRSVILPFASIVAGYYFIKDPKWAIYIWLLSIPLSLFMGEWFQNFFAGLGFDDRMSSYSYDNDEIDADAFSSTGFRWDFLAFSAAAVAMAWQVCIKRKCSDRIYDVITIAYCLSNAFWVLVIRAPFSNRFAYLSWFMMPLVIAYPLINLAVWTDQDRKTGLILAAYCSFTLIMNFLWGV